jgi:hypothetical protein
MEPTTCWNAFCIAGDCNEVDHYDYTGRSWSQRRGYSYNPETGNYDAEEQTGPVFTMYERITEDEPEQSGESP